MLNVKFETFFEERYWFYLRKMLDKLIEWALHMIRSELFIF
jgi:hypothetical protein